MMSMQNALKQIHPLETLHPRPLKYLADYLQLIIRG